MIDTDKYEGHTPAPWTLSEEYAYELFIYAGDVRLAKMDGNAPLYLDEHGNPEDLNAQLIADAPLLLAEVKRLREENDVLAEAVKEDNEILKKHIETLAEVKRLRELLLPRIDEGYTTSYMDLRKIIEDVHWELTGDDHESNEERIKYALIALKDVIR